MKQKTILFFAVMILMTSNLMSNNELISVFTIENVASVEGGADLNMEINGTIQLYSISKEDIELIDTEIVSMVYKNEASDWTLVYNRDYFIGYSDAKVVAITPSNFKQIARKYFTDVPELAAMIGKSGFRYKNLPAIILYYNKKITKNKGLTKKDRIVVKEMMYTLNGVKQ